MSFLHPWALAIGVAASALPVLIHWLTRPRPVRMPLSTLRFVREAVHQQRTWHRLRDFILLALRTLAILALALAVARPQWGQSPVSDIQGGDAVRVVLLDVSQSMAARVGAVEQIERARTIAAGYLRYRPGLAANLILAAARPQSTFDGPSTNFDALRDELAHCHVLPERLDANRALDAAARMLAPVGQNDRRRREMVVVSDFQRSSRAKADFSPLPADAQIQIESTAPAEPPANLAILRVEGRTAGAGGNVQLDVDVGNDAPLASPPQKVTVEVTLGDSTWRLTGACPSGRPTTLTEEIGPRRPGWQSGEARLVGVDDALAADNVRPFVLRVRPRPTYLLLTRQPVSRKPTSSLFIECALAPASKRGQTVIRINPTALDRTTAAAGDLVVLDHPGRLSDDAVKLLAELLHRGRPIVYVASELIDATNLKRLADAAGSGLQMPVEFTPPPAGQARRDLFYASVRGNDPPFAVFGDALTATLGRLRFAGGLGSRRLDTGADSDVLAAYNDGSAGLVLTASDAGVLAVVNADLGTSNLPKTSAFVPLLGELVEQMIERRHDSDATYCGEPLMAHLPTEVGMAAGLRVRGPKAAGADGQCGQLADEAVGVVWRWPSPGPAGVYRIERDGATVFAAAATIPPDESNLESLFNTTSSNVLTPQQMIARLAAGRTAVYRGAGDEGRQQDDFWNWLAVACVLCILSETSALLVFRA